MNEAERFQVAGGRRPFDLDVVHVGLPRALPGGLDQALELVPLALGDKLDGAVGPVADPAANTQRSRRADDEVAKAHTLHVTTNYRMKAFDGSRLARMASSILAIGDELVGGFTLDTNSHWLAERLRLLGYPAKRVTQIRDRPVEIVEQVHRELADAEVSDVFCSGGLGPTPDDRTFAALADALGRELIIWEETRARIERRVQRMHEAGILDSPEVTEGNLRMARIPDKPAHVFKNRRGMAPGVVYEQSGKRIFVLPGVPLEMKGIFTEELEPAFLASGAAATVRELRFTFAVEARFYPLMRELEEAYPDVSVGSYPNFETKELVIRCLGTDPKRVEEVLEIVRRRSADLGMPGVSSAR